MATNKKHRQNGEGTLFKRKDGRWQASFMPDNGKRRYVYGKSKGQALDKLHQAQGEDKQGILATGPKQKLSEYLPQWLESVYKPSVRIQSYLQYRSIMQHHLIPGFGHIYLQKLTPQRIQVFYSQKSEEGLKPGTIAMIHKVLYGALENAVKWNIITRNPSASVSLPRIEEYKAYALSFEQAQELLATASGHWIKPILFLAVTTGMRRGELLGLRWNDIDLQKKVLNIRRTMNKVPHYGVIENDPKTKASRRRVMLPDVVIDALNEHKLQQDKIKEQAGQKWLQHNLVFCNEYGDFLTPNKVLRHFQKLLVQASLPHMRLHDLRHSAATILLTMGVHPKVVQELLGHSTIAMTMDRYSHLLPSMQQDAVNKMNTAFDLDNH